ncbi:hypothetical protein [uncultured Piscinibacter sp.]|uniref:hypothetical protein n=1 Tax=uncultured Piscinibacter sp. TaxID=1131835 RepID=UPI0026074D61|nr:hypothetical protein [uncultured Piscinibacter sp.]
MTNRHLNACLLALAAVLPAHAADVDVGVSISVGQPGFYGRIDIGHVPQPVLVYPQPVIIQPAPVAVVRQPIYLHVPPGHAKDWERHCYRYAACNQPVYFVQDRWYQEVYVPQYRQRYAPPPPPSRKYRHDDDRRGQGYDDRGRGKKGDDHRGKGKGRDKD